MYRDYSNMQYPEIFQDKNECFKRLPGIGNKSAERMAYHVLNMDEDYVDMFADVLSRFQKEIHYCKKCGNISDHDLCEICEDESRDHQTICVVESPKDVFAMEKVKEYKGVYHVLNGTISIMDGKMMEDLNILSLFDRIHEDTKEIIIATNPTREGETTALYLARLLSKYNVNVTRIANGLPIGSNIDYADEISLLKSLEGRKKI